jgi:hypothetical protein
LAQGLDFLWGVLLQGEAGSGECTNLGQDFRDEFRFSFALAQNYC